jgi:hypothetical protein
MIVAAILLEIEILSKVDNRRPMRSVDRDELHGQQAMDGLVLRAGNGVWARTSSAEDPSDAASLEPSRSERAVDG